MWFQNLLRGILDELGELADGSNRLEWKGILQQTPLIATGDDVAKVAFAAGRGVEWIGAQGSSRV